MRRIAALTFAGLCIASAANAQTAREMPEYKRKGLPSIYRINLGTTWQDITSHQPPKIDFAGKARKDKECGEDTYFTITLDFDNTQAYVDRDTALDTFDIERMSASVRRMFYPGGEVYEMEAPKRMPFAGDNEAFVGMYRITFSDGRRYRMRHYTTFESGYYFHLNTYNLSKDDLRAAPCFAELIDHITFQKVKAK